MANLEGHAADSVIQALRDKQCCGHDFFRAVRLIQAARPDLPVIGTSKSPQDDPVRFGQRPSLGFAPSALDELVLEPDQPPKLYVNFMGLFGPNGPLPLHLTQYALRRLLGQGVDENGDPRSRLPGAAGPARAAGSSGVGGKDLAFADFFDIFHHRLISLFFRAWSVSRPTVDLDRPERQRFLFFLGAFVGESNADLEGLLRPDPDHIPLQARLYYSGRLASPARNAEALEAILQDYFGVPVTVREFVGHWFDLPEGDRCKLGASRDAGLLGENLILGSRTWTAHLCFRLRLGPMTLEDYSRFLPGEKGFRLLTSWVTNYCGTELLWDVQLVLRAGEVPGAQLGRAGKLGWTIWLKTKPFERDVMDLVVAPPVTLN